MSVSVWYQFVFMSSCKDARVILKWNLIQSVYIWSHSLSVCNIVVKSTTGCYVEGSRWGETFLGEFTSTLGHQYGV